MGSKDQTAARIITVASGSAQAGTTTVTAAVALLAQAMGLRVLVVDSGAGEERVAGIVGARPTWDLAAVLDGKVGLREALCTAHLGAKLLTTDPRAAHPTAEQGLRLVGELDAAKALFDLILLDAGPIGGEALFLTGLADKVLLVMDRREGGVGEAHALVRLLAERAAQVQYDLVVNRATREEARRIFGQFMLAAEQDRLASFRYLGHLREVARQGVHPRVPILATCPIVDRLLEAAPGPSRLQAARRVLVGECLPG